MNDKLDSFRYQVGQIVKVRDDLKLDKSYKMQSGGSTIDLPVISVMMKYAGKKCRITNMAKSCGEFVYRIEWNGMKSSCDWTDEMFKDENCIFYSLI